MKLLLPKETIFVFDLDDTLFYEIDYLKSAYQEIAETLKPQNSFELYDIMLQKYNLGENVFEFLLNEYREIVVDIEDLLNLYRNHIPNITLKEEVKDLLNELIKNKIKIGLITDGRSITQRNKLKSLEIENYFNDIIISEEFGTSKPNELNYKYFMDKYPNNKYIYLGDNPKKDFVTANKLDWLTICLLDEGKNIHKQKFDIEKEYLPILTITSFKELEIIYEH